MTYYLAFIFGFFGSLHCLGMCGPIVMAYTVPLTKSNVARKLYLIVPHLLYNLGRTLTYAVLGALAGGIGSEIFRLSTLIGTERVLFIIFGLLLLIVGLALTRIISMPQSLLNSSLFNITAYQTTLGRFLAMPSWGAKFFLGLLMGLLPCHLIYAMLLQATALGSASKGAFLMLAFGLGTTPALVLTAFFSNLFSSSVRNWGDRLLGAGVLMLAIMLIVRGAGYDMLMFGHQDHSEHMHMHHH